MRLVLAMLAKDASARPTAEEIEAELNAAAGASARATPARRPSAATWSGRDRERARLAALLPGVAAGRGMMAGVVGEAGIGKTSLVEEVLAEIERGPHRPVIARGKCSERLAGAEAYLPILEIARSSSSTARPPAVRRDDETRGANVVCPGRPALARELRDERDPGRHQEHVAGADEARACRLLPGRVAGPPTRAAPRGSALGRRLDSRCAELSRRPLRRHAPAGPRDIPPIRHGGRASPVPAGRAAAPRRERVRQVSARASSTEPTSSGTSASSSLATRSRLRSSR